MASNSSPGTSTGSSLTRAERDAVTDLHSVLQRHLEPHNPTKGVRLLLASAVRRGLNPRRIYDAAGASLPRAFDPLPKWELVNPALPEPPEAPAS